MPMTPRRARGARWGLRAAAAPIGLLALVVATALTAFAAPALASHAQLAMFQDDAQVKSDPARALEALRHLGVGVVRVTVGWSSIAPSPRSHRRPSFDAADPSAYPAASWAVYDEIDRYAAVTGIQVDFVVAGGSPLWADAAGNPSSDLNFSWKPSAREYGLFVRAVAARYGGNYTPRGSAAALPRIHFWEIWNEANFGEDLDPQAIDGSSVSVGPGMYRGLVNAGWSSLQATGHGHDTILIGGLAARGLSARASRRLPGGLPGVFGTTKPLQFIRTLYCVDSRFRELRGRAASAVGCPTSASGSRRFRSANPGLFGASGFGIHPYPVGEPPTKADSNDPDFVEFSELPRLASTLDRTQRTYGSRTRFAIYNTEYGYITNPPNRSGRYASPTTAAYYTNWAEYLSWRNPRIATTMQYLLDDPNPRVGVPEFGGFASGLIFFGGGHKPGFSAYRLPLYLPVTTTRKSRSVEVWGAVRPDPYAALDSGTPQQVQIQFQPGSRGAFVGLQTVTVTDPHGYFDLPVRFPSSGTVRLAWTYPSGDPLLQAALVDPTSLLTTYSRPVKVTVL
jgi:hypothetical protein